MGFSSARARLSAQARHSLILSILAGGFGDRASFQFASAFRLVSLNCLFDLVVRVAALYFSDPLILLASQFV